MSKCIKCGRELTSGEIPEFNYGMCDKCYKDYQCKQYPFKKEMFDMQDEIKQLKQQLAEKDKEIEKLKQQYTILENENGKLTTELIMGKYKKAQKEVSFGKQLAIQELEKVKDWLNEPFDEDGCFKIGGDLIDFIDQQIKELKGEKHVKD